jgi:hypothetical protein
MTQPKDLDVENLDQFLEQAFAADDDEAIFIAQLRHYDPRAAEKLEQARHELQDAVSDLRAAGKVI